VEESSGKNAGRVGEKRRSRSERGDVDDSFHKSDM
jgi:hypothetical protein